MKFNIFTFVVLLYFTNCLNCSKKVKKYIMKICSKKTKAKEEKGKWIIGCGLSDEDYSITHKRIIKNTVEKEKKIVNWHLKKLITIIEPELNKYMNNFNWKQHEFDALCIYGTKGNSVQNICKNANNKLSIQLQLKSPEKEIFKNGKYNFKYF